MKKCSPFRFSSTSDRRTPLRCRNMLRWAVRDDKSIMIHGRQRVPERKTRSTEAAPRRKVHVVAHQGITRVRARYGTDCPCGRIDHAAVPRYRHRAESDTVDRVRRRRECLGASASRLPLGRTEEGSRFIKVMSRTPPRFRRTIVATAVVRIQGVSSPSLLSAVSMILMSIESSLKYRPGRPPQGVGPRLPKTVLFQERLWHQTLRHCASWHLRVFLRLPAQIFYH